MFTVALHPSALADPLAGARAALDAMKMRRVDALGGVLMSYDDAALCGARRRGGDDDASDDETSTSESDDASADDDDGRGGFGRVLHASGHVDVRVEGAVRGVHAGEGIAPGRRGEQGGARFHRRAGAG